MLLLYYDVRGENLNLLFEFHEGNRNKMINLKILRRILNSIQNKTRSVSKLRLGTTMSNMPQDIHNLRLSVRE